jgi:hypothetical protein
MHVDILTFYRMTQQLFWQLFPNLDHTVIIIDVDGEICEFLLTSNQG